MNVTTSPMIATAISHGGMGTSDILSGMIIGAENGNMEATRANVLVGLSRAGWMNSALLIAAGVYQLTPAKRACLEHCQSPLGFLMSHWRDGPAGTYQMGIRHGIYCLGCCWALMAVLFAVGVMNLAWVGALTVFILLERIGRRGALVARVGGVLMVGLGILRFLVP